MRLSAKYLRIAVRLCNRGALSSSTRSLEAFMSLRRTFLVAALGLVPACNPYQNFSGNYYAGAVDATGFPAAYLGTLPGTPDQGGGVIAPIAANSGGNPVNYYLFPFSSAQTTAPDDMTPAAPLSIGLANVPEVPAYVFDPTASSAFPSPSKCVAPAHYVFDQRTEAYRHDEQGVIFTDLPDDPAYVPVVAQVPVTSHGEKCQSILDADAVNQKRIDIDVGDPDGNYLAFAIVDPGADVQPDALPYNLGPQHWGFWDRYLLAFIDGGYIPTTAVAKTDTVPAHHDMHTQKIYVPNTYPGTTLDANMNSIPTTCPSMDKNATCDPPGPGNEFDILEAIRGDAKYSPVCEVWAYDPDLDATGIPVPATDINGLSQTEQVSAMATGTYVFCLQVQP
jgi:hypothetical protein